MRRVPQVRCAGEGRLACVGVRYVRLPVRAAAAVRTRAATLLHVHPSRFSPWRTRRALTVALGALAARRYHIFDCGSRFFAAGVASGGASCPRVRRQRDARRVPCVLPRRVFVRVACRAAYWARSGAARQPSCTPRRAPAAGLGLTGLHDLTTSRARARDPTRSAAAYARAAAARCARRVHTVLCGGLFCFF